MAFEQVKLRTAEGQEYGPISMETLAQWRREGRVPDSAMVVDAVTGEAQPISAFPMLMIAPPPMPGAPGAYPTTSPSAPSGIDNLIPAKNPYALFAYYSGCFGVIPCFTVFLGPVALILGLLGLRDYKRLDIGKAHAILGIVLGGLEILAIIAVIILLITGKINSL